MFGSRKKEIQELREKTEVYVVYRSGSCSGYKRIDIKDLLWLILNKLDLKLEYDPGTHGEFQLNKRKKDEKNHVW
jgi:hypothetical protein